MRKRVSTSTPFQIDLSWWAQHGRDLRLYLAAILEDPSALDTTGGEPLDYIDPVTAEVLQLDPLWTSVLVKCAHRADYISPTTPLASAVLRALIENVNRPMTVVDLHRRIGRGTPETLLRMLPSAREAYGIAPAIE